MVTLRDIARELGVTESTVSRALLGRSTLKSETIQRVRDAAEKMGYVPNLVARSLVSRHTGMIGLALPSLDYAHGEFFSRLFEGIERAAAQRGAILLLFPFQELTKTGFGYESLLDGMIILGPLKSPRGPEMQMTKPAVLLDQRLKGMPSVFSDNRGGAEAAVNRLIKLGHRRILFVGGPEEHPTVRERLRGAMDAVRASQITGVELKAVHVDWRKDLEAGRAAIREAAARFGKERNNGNGWAFTGILAANDMLAVGAILELKDKGLRVPEDVSVIGFDDCILCDIVRPTLSSVRQQASEMGAAAVEMLYGRIGKHSTNVKETWETTLVERGSTGPAPGTNTSSPG
jgi:DNA-binding LacI/PurR family transcriptional regulator